jgi:hypothetical protein
VNDSTDVGALQLRLIASARAFIDTRAGDGVDVALDPECYLNSWAPCVGNARLRELAFGRRARPARLLARARDAASLLSAESAVLMGEGAPTHHSSLIVSWALPTDFDAAGNYRDRYLNLDTGDTPNTLWFLILLSGAPPKALAPNVRLLHQAGRGRAQHWRASGFSGTAARAQEIAALVAQCRRRHGCMQVLLPYEAQPFQHAICRAVMHDDARVRTVGYVHSSLPALPTDYLMRDGAPDRVLVHGEGQAEILARDLGWPRERLAVIDSLRYLRDAQVPFAGCILLPYAFEDADFIAGRIEAMFAAAAPGSFPRWKVRNHPVMKESAVHLALAARLEAIIDRHADKTSPNAELGAQTLMIGATAAVIEALERGLDVVHLCANELFERHSSRLWTCLETIELAPQVCRYRLKSRGTYIRLGADARASARSLDLN